MLQAKTRGRLRARSFLGSRQGTRGKINGKVLLVLQAEVIAFQDEFSKDLAGLRQK